MMELLQKKNDGKIVICNMGNFYISIGKDAILLNRLINLKVSCFKPEICKVGFPINSLVSKSSFVKTTFNQRRKTLRNSIKPVLGKDSSLYADEIFNKRPEQLSVMEFIELTNRVEKALNENMQKEA